MKKKLPHRNSACPESTAAKTEAVFGTPMAYATIHALERYILKKEK